MKKVVAMITMLIGIVLILRGWWLMASFGVSGDEWMKDFVAGFCVLLIGSIANAGSRRV